MSKFVLAWDENGNLARTFNYLASSPIWEDIQGSIQGNVNDADFDWQSEFITSGYTRGKLGAYVVTTSGTTLRVYYSSDVRALNVSWTLQESFTMNDSSVTTAARIVTSRTVPGFAILAWKDRTGTLVARTTDGGVNWSSASRVGASISDASSNDNLDIGLDVDGEVQLITAPASAAGEYGLYKATTKSGSFSAVTNMEEGIRPFPTVVMDKADSSPVAYVSVLGPQPADETVTFDGGGYSNYEVCLSEPEGTVTEGSGGNDGNCVRNDATVPDDSGHTYTVRTWVGFSEPIYGPITVTADFYFSWSGTWGGSSILRNASTGAYVSFDDIPAIPCNSGFSPNVTGTIGASFDPLNNPSLNGIWRTLTGTYTEPGVIPYKYVALVARFATGTFFSGGVVSVRIDNIRVQSTGVNILYRVSNYTGSSTWTDITPADNRAPVGPYGLAVDRADVNNLVVVAENDTDRRFYLSTDKGSAWIDKGIQTPQGVKRYNSKLNLFGSGGLDYSANLGLAKTSKNGNWASVFGSVGTIRGVLDPVADALPAPKANGFQDCSESADKMTAFPVSLRSGEKFEQVTDLSVNTPAGPLAFTRTYRQARLSDTNYQFMGAGWIHNHAVTLTEDTGVTPNTIVVRMPSGGEIELTKTRANHYDGAAGTLSTIDVNPGSTTARYTLETPDKSVYVFDDEKRLRSRTWPSGEVWTYNYDGNDRLSEVVDMGYDTDPGAGTVYRRLQFTYISNPSQFDDGQLWRVGDHLATGLSGGSPAGRYVEFSYVTEKNDGDEIGSPPKALLASVRDVRGNVWTYDYYGQDEGEDDSDQQSFLVGVFTPSVDSTGDGTPDGAITRKIVNYTVSGGDITDITEELGIQGAAEPLMEVALAFQPDGQNVTHETVAGQTTIHRFDGGVYAGAENPNGDYNFRSLNPRYRPESQVDANGNETLLEWSADGKRLLNVADALGRQTAFDYTSDETLHSSQDAEGRRTIYAYEDGDNSRQPTAVLVTDGNDLAVNGGMEADSDWTDVGTPTLNERTPGADSGQYTRHVVADAADEGIEGNSWDLEANDPYVITARVYVVSGAVKMHVTGETAFDRVSTLTGEWETLTASYTPGSTSTGKQFQFLAADDSAEFYVDSVSIRQAGEELAVNGGMEADSDWDDISGSEPVVNEQTVGADSGLYARRVVADANEGIEGTNWDLVAGRTYVILARVYPISGTVRMKVSGTSAFDQTTGGNGAWETLRAVYTPTANAADVTLQFLADGGAAEFYVDTVHILDSTMILRWQEFTYDSMGRTLTEKIVDPADGTTVQQQVTRAYYSSGDGNGLLQTITQEEIGGSNDVTTTYTYDSAGRVVKTQQSSNFGSCDISYTVYDAAGNVVASICNYDPGMSADPTTAAEAAALYDPDFPDKNRVTTHEYDTLGRRVKTTVNDGASFKQATLTFYDALDRVVRTIANYVNQSGGSPEEPGLWVWSETNTRWETSASDDTPISHGAEDNENLISDTAYNARGMVRLQRDTLGNVALFGYDDAGRLIKTVQNASEPDYDNDYGLSGNPDLSDYDASANADEDVITEQAYDPVGNLVKTVDPLGVVTFTVYDPLNRPVKVVRAAKDEATVAINPGGQGYDEANDPRSDNYEPSTDPDRDLIETTEYDAMGRVIRTRRLLDNRPTEQWDTTLFGYDLLGRQVMVIRGASDPNYDIAADPDLSEYDASSAADLDIVTQTGYDSNGRVQHTEDALGVKTRFVYDGLGRQVRTIANYVAQATDPDTWAWDDTDGRWEDGSGTAIDHGDDNDQNVITETIYDDDGRVESTRDVLGRVSRNVYDEIGRIIRTVSNFVDQGEDPAEWVWNSGWKQSDGTTPIAHGADDDQNVIASTVYDDQGRVASTIDHRNNETLYFYDAVGRRVKTITNYLFQGASDPVDWLWVSNQWEDGDSNAISFGGDNDQNRISTTTYDLAGRVTRSRDAAGIETRFGYDALGRRTKTTANYVDGVFSASFPDEDLISTTAYNKGGQVVSTTDTRGTQTAFTYDQAGRRLTVIQAASSSLESASYTNYDKAGRVLRTIQNYVPLNDALGQPILPDAKDSDGHWRFAPPDNGSYNDRNLVTTFLLDASGRRVRTADALGNEALTGYDKDGQVKWLTDPAYTLTHYRYDKLRRRIRVVQGYQPVPTQSKIAFVSFRDGNYEVYSMNADGTGQTNLTNNPGQQPDPVKSGQDHYPVWSPDGSQIVFVSNRNGGEFAYYDVYVMDANGANVQQLTNLSGYAAEPAWSPDGGQIAFSFQQPGDRYALYLMNANGSNLRQAYSDPNQNAGRPVWSPEGQRLAFYGSPDGSTGDLHVVHADGSQRLNLTNYAAAGNFYPAWSPDGSRIAFRTARDGNAEIYVMNADGSNPVNLTQYAGAADSYPAWSPDGGQLVFYSNRDGDREVYKMNADGAGVTQLTSNSGLDDWYPHWSPQVVDPAAWVWDSGQSRWEDGDGNALPHGDDNDRNIIVDVAYDVAGRMVSLRNPAGAETTYDYDLLNRRKSLTNPISETWATAYPLLTTGGTSTILTDPNGVDTERNFDRLGRLASIQYDNPGNTPDVKFSYNNAGNRAAMSEYSGAGFTSKIRETSYSYDDVRRLTSVGFDNDGGGSVDETVSYEYDAGGLRTKLILPGSLEVVYTYDPRGQLVSLTDWDNQQTQYAYDLARRLIAAERANGLRSRYQYDPAGRLRLLRHSQGFRTLAYFEYQMDKRGNRVQALEWLANPATTSDTTIAYDDKRLVLTGVWSDVSGFKESSQFSATLSLIFFGDEATLTMGRGPDHSIYDVYVDGALWQSFDGYAASADEQTIVINGGNGSKLQGDGPHLLEIRNRAERNINASGYTVRFKQLVVADRTDSIHTIEYAYDNLSRLTEARYNPGTNLETINDDLLRRYLYSFDLAGNRRTEQVWVNGSQTADITYDYNAANQLIDDGTYTYEYDGNGNLRYKKLTGTPVETYTWNRANRLVMWDNGTPADLLNYRYDGLNNRISRSLGTTSPVVTQYLLDLQPGLSVVLAATVDTDVTRYVHGPKGIHAQQSPAGAWSWMTQDGLGSVRGMVNNSVGVDEVRLDDPFGNSVPGAPYDYAATVYGFTGELTETVNPLVHLRARDYHPALGVFTALDPFEGVLTVPMSINGYGYVMGDPINSVDPLGLFQESNLIDPGSGTFGSIGLPAPSTASRFFEGLLAAAAAIIGASNAGVQAPSLPGQIPSYPGIYNPDENPFELPIIVTPRPPLVPGPERPPTPEPGGPDWLRRLLAALTGAGSGYFLWRFIERLACPQRPTDPAPTVQPAPTPAPTATATATPQPCDPDRFEDWWNSRPLAGGVYDLDWYRYEQQVTRDARYAPGTIAGIRPRTIPAGSELVDADGAIKSNCRLLDAKYGPPAPWANVDDEVRRYRQAVVVPNGVAGAQPSGLEIRTTSESLRSLFEGVLQRWGFTINVDGFVTIHRFRR